MELSEEVIDGIRELVTIGVGRSAGMLNELTRAHVTLTVPEVKIIDAMDTHLNPPWSVDTEETSQVILPFFGEFTGSLRLLIPYSSAINLVALLTGEEGTPDEMDALRVETLIEVGNIIISSVMSSFSILLLSHLTFLYPRYRTGMWEDEQHSLPSDAKTGIVATTRFQILDREIEGVLFFLVTRETTRLISSRIIGIMERGLI